MIALHIKANGEKTEVVPLNNKTFSLEELQKFVDGPIEMLLTKDQQTMIVNEEGRLRNFAVNEEASALIDGCTIVGDVLVCDWSSLQE